jgi:CBS domain-containing protein
MEVQERHIGSMLVTNAQGEPLGILTRSDILERVTLSSVSLEKPISAVMVQPVHCLSVEQTAGDAVLLMSRRGVRHVPITRKGVAVGIVSERDLFAMQRMSLNHVSTSIRSARNVEELKLSARNIRLFARSLLSQGVQSRQLSSLISHLNDVLTERLLLIKAKAHGIDLQQLCWLALGSEGRNEQTIATDQDNAVILADVVNAAQRAAVLVFAKDVNAALDACGYPLCKGGIMAGNPDCCMTLTQWRDRFAKWIDHGAPEDLLNASIYFDFRPLAGDFSLAGILRDEVNAAAKVVPRFFKQMALNALTRRVPLNWIGGIAVDEEGRIDLKLQGTSIFVDAARLYALAHGIAQTATRDRLLFVGPLIGASAAEFEGWVSGFEFLQMLRLQVQLQEMTTLDRCNQIEVASLNDIDRRILRETFRVGRSLQQRMQLDYDR